jgi:indole-3-glycerol phosphate synthase
MTILDRIVEVKRQEIEILHRDFSYSRFSESPFFQAETLDLCVALTSNRDISVIAEIKKASPSRGTIRSDFDHLEIAQIYQRAGADALSILTDREFFQGDIRYLKEIAIQKQVPLLRKDFIIDEFQVLEARSNGADAILLIAEILDRQTITDLTQTASDLGMAVLLELHSAGQLEKIDPQRNRLPVLGRCPGGARPAAVGDATH